MFNINLKTLIKLVRKLERNTHDRMSVCPKCKKSQIQILGSLNGWLTPSLYFCKKCGYTGSIIIEIEQ